MAQNPFMVDAGNDYSQGLAGLSNTFANVRRDRMMQAEQQRQLDREERAQKRFEEVQGAAQEAFASQDPDKIAQISIKYPEITEMLKQTTGLQDELKNREAVGFTRAFALASPESRPALYEQRIQSILDRGGDPSNTIASYEDYKRDPDAEVRDVIGYWAGIDPKGYSVYSDERKAQQKADLEQQKMAAEESRFQRGEAGKNSRAALSAADRSLTREIAALTARQGAEMNDLKKQELGLKIEEKQNKLEQNKVDTQKSVDTDLSNLDSSIAAADKLLSHPGLSSAVGLSSVIPTRPGSDASDFEAELDSYNAKTFMSNVSKMKGLGALTEAEGAKITSAAGAVRKDMSEKALKANLKTMRDGMETARKRLAKRAGIPPDSSSGGWEIID